jgi:hypothetical protein
MEPNVDLERVELYLHGHLHKVQYQLYLFIYLQYLSCSLNIGGFSMKVNTAVA